MTQQYRDEVEGEKTETVLANGCCWNAAQVQSRLLGSVEHLSNIVFKGLRSDFICLCVNIYDVIAPKDTWYERCGDCAVEVAYGGHKCLLLKWALRWEVSEIRQRQKWWRHDECERWASDATTTSCKMIFHSSPSAACLSRLKHSRVGWVKLGGTTFWIVENGGSRHCRLRLAFAQSLKSEK